MSNHFGILVSCHLAIIQAEQLEGRDLAVTKISINMGKTSTDSLGRSNPVEKMLFYHKGNLQATKSEI